VILVWKWKYWARHANELMSDFNAVEAVVDVTHRYPEMFYPKEQ
jgi:hypothetical protein